MEKNIVRNRQFMLSPNLFQKRTNSSAVSYNFSESIDVVICDFNKNDTRSVCLFLRLYNSREKKSEIFHENKLFFCEVLTDVFK